MQVNAEASVTMCEWRVKVQIGDKREREWKGERKKMRKSERVTRKKKQRRYNLYF